MRKIPDRPTVFVSYSRKDEVGKERPWSVSSASSRARGCSAPRDDRRIAVGDEWFEEIREASGRARAALLLISPDFLRSHHPER